MESELLVGWQEERAELRAELSRLQDELAESRAEREELESRAQALTDRVRRESQMGSVLHLQYTLSIRTHKLSLGLYVSCLRRWTRLYRYLCAWMMNSENGGKSSERAEREKPDRPCSSINFRTRSEKIQILNCLKKVY